MNRKNTASTPIPGPPLARVWKLAWPHAIMNTLFTLLMLIDMYWVSSWGGDAPLNAIAICGPILWTVQSASMFVFYGMLALIARCVGAGDEERARLISHQGILVGFAVGCCIAVLGVTTAKPLIGLYHTTPEIHAMAVRYLVILHLLNPMFYLFMSLYAIFSAHNNTRDPMVMTLIAWVLNMVLAPMLVLGIGPFPSLGITGAAIATLTAYLCATVAFLIFFHRALAQYAHVQSLRDFIPRWGIIREIMGIGAPASLNGISRPTSAIVLMGLVTLYGTHVVAGFGVAVRVISVNWIVLGGLNVAVSSLTGQFLGAGAIDEAKRTVRFTWMAAMVFQVAISTLMFCCGSIFAGAFTSDPTTLVETTALLSVFAICTVADVYIAVYGGALNGAGDTARAMTASLFANWVFKLPLCYFMARFYPAKPLYLYWAVSLSIPLEGLINYFWFRQGAWARKKLKVFAEHVAPGGIPQAFPMDADPKDGVL